MDISSKSGYPSSALSNFAPHPFVLDGVEINSMEGFLQSLKFKSPDMQEYVCKLVGAAAKKKGSDKNWKKTQTLYWRGKEIDRHSDEYQELLDRAYDALFQNEGFKKALLASKDSVYKHSMGKSNPKDTILTTSEFCSRLTKLRNRL
jgi:predicted NAD-dependent protein-ADP-ribosyltransferase YbiA (DUF1768 family)